MASRRHRSYLSRTEMCGRRGRCWLTVGDGGCLGDYEGKEEVHGCGGNKEGVIKVR